MIRLKILLFVLVLSLDGAIANNSVFFLSKKNIQYLQHSILEVVVPKLEDDNIKYEKKISFDKLSYRERTDKFHSIGTAFFISETELVSAAHVLSLENYSLWTDLSVRNVKGKIFKIDKIIKYSSYRDLVVFSLKSYPKKIHPIKKRSMVELGDTVISAGNALGEGISFRGGQVASFTPEDVNGKWKFIRFSSPASPGNSGGPLLNNEGEVVGIIVMKNRNENFNYAIPLTELKNLPHSKAEFFIRNVQVADDLDSIMEDWNYFTKIPATISELSEQSQESLYDFYVKLTTKFVEEKGQKLFPLHPRYREYLRNQNLGNHFGQVVKMSKSNKWTVQYLEYHRIPIDKDHKILFGRGKLASFEVVVEKPNSVKLVDFINDPQLIVDTMLRGIPLTRTVGKEKIRIESYGTPIKTFFWKDKLGRSWISSKWEIKYNNTFLYNHCLPVPKGVSCQMEINRTERLGHAYEFFFQEGVSELMLSYAGSVKDWKEYLSLEKKYLPAFFHSNKISYKKDKNVDIKMGEVSIAYATTKIDDKSQVHVHMGFSTVEKLALDLLLLEFFPEKGRDDNVRVYSLYEAGEFNGPEYVAKWKHAVGQIGKYNGKVYPSDSNIRVNHVFKSAMRKIASFQTAEIKKLYVASCIKSSSSSKKQLAKECQKFKKSIVIH